MSRLDPFSQQQQSVPVVLMNPPIPSLSPYLAILYSQFLARKVWLESFTFSCTWNTLAANAAGQQALMTIDPSIDFIALEMNLTSFSAVGAVVATPDYLLEVQEKSGNNNWSDGAIHVSNWTGQTRDGGASPWRFPFERYIRGNNTVQFKLTNNTATAARVDLALNGIRVTYVDTDRAKLFGVPY